MPLLHLIRHDSNEHTTLGHLYGWGRFLGNTLEDAHQDTKISGRTRIPAGHYEVGVQHSGRNYSRYSRKYDWHKGMLLIRDVPGFEGAQFHPGNTHEDTRGCVLVGELIRGWSLVNSVYQYKRFYEAALPYAVRGDLELLVSNLGGTSTEPGVIREDFSATVELHIQKLGSSLFVTQR